MDLSYGFANARIKAMEAQLLKQDQFRELSVVGSLPEVITLLEETGYKSDLVAASQHVAALQHVEHIQIILIGLQNNFSATLKKLGSVLPKKAKALYAMVVGEWEVQDIKTIISKKMLGEKVSEKDLILASENSRRIAKKLLSAESLAEMLDFLKATEYGAALKKVDATKDDFRQVLDALDKSFYAHLREFANSVSEKSTRDLLRARLELINNLLVLRLKPHASSEQIESFLIGSPSLVTKRLLAAKDVDEALHELALPDDVYAQYHKTRALSTIELALEKRFVQNVLRQFRASVLSFGVVLGFLYIKSSEVNTIKRLALGKYFGVEEEMKQHLYWVS